MTSNSIMNNFGMKLKTRSNSIAIAAQILLNFKPFCDDIRKLFSIFYDLILQNEANRNNVDLNPLIQENFKDPNLPLEFDVYYSDLINSLTTFSEGTSANFRNMFCVNIKSEFGNETNPFISYDLGFIQKQNAIYEVSNHPQLLSFKADQESNQKILEKIYFNYRSYSIYSVVCNDTINNYKLFIKIDNKWYSYTNNKMIETYERNFKRIIFLVYAKDNNFYYDSIIN